MKILVLGANGKVGSRVSAQLIAHGHTVIAGIHKNTANVPKQAKIINLDITDKDSLIAALANIDAVVCALSSWGSPKHNILSTTMESLIPTMRQMGIKRIVSISGDIALLPGERPDIFVKLTRAILFGAVRKVVLDSENHLRQLHESDLDWTVIRPTTMSSSANATYIFSNKHPLTPIIPRVAVVNSIVDLIENHSHIHEAPYILTA